VAQPNINVPAICAIRLPTPPLDMQRRFERHVRTVDTVLEQQRRAVEVAYKAFTALLSRTFNGHPAAIPLAAEGAAVA
jgi:restriction endonuclease S subunit